MSCPNYTFRQNDYYCMKKGDYVNSDTYYRYCRNYSYDDCPIYKHEEVSGCYLTTIVCNILNKKDDDKVLNSLRFFRDDVLQTDEKYHNILKDYDIIGPVISYKIANDKDKEIMSNYLYNTFLCPISCDIEDNKKVSAIEKYRVMTLALINYYGIKKIYNKIDYNIKNFDAKNAGHGKILSSF